MKVNELRVDNFILFKEWGRGKGKIGQMKRGDFGRFNDEEYHPVQITSKWLERFGFTAKQEPEEPLMYSILKMDLDLAKEEDGYYLRTNNTDPYHNTNIGVRIEYLHQLQNAYFALTGEELHVKL